MNTLFSKRNLPVVILNISTILIVAIMLMVSQALAKQNQSTTATTLNAGGLSYQGTLMDSSGYPLTGIYEITFRIYDAPSDGTLLWEEVRSGANAVPVYNGLFNVMMGSLNPIPEVVWEISELFLGLKIGNDEEMSPLQPIGSVPSALQANIAFTVPDSSITTAQLADGAVTIQKLGIGRYPFVYSDNVVRFSGPNGYSELNITTCTTTGTWCCNAANQICYYPGGTADSIVAFNIQNSPSLACALYHNDDDTTSASRGFYYATDGGNSQNPFGTWAVKLSREGETGWLLFNNSSYVWICQ